MGDGRQGQRQHLVVNALWAWWHELRTVELVGGNEQFPGNAKAAVLVHDPVSSRHRVTVQPYDAPIARGRVHNRLAGNLNALAFKAFLDSTRTASFRGDGI